MPAPTSSSSRHRHTHRKRTARWFLVGIALLLIAAELSLFSFALGKHNTWKLLPGFLFGQTLATALLLGGIWRRMAWARYVLAVLLLFTIALTTLCTLSIGSKPEGKDPQSLALLTSGAALMTAAVTWLIRSRRIRYLATPPGSGG
jgi:peptidoglycan/LPS O-acetylase OafA/YrhL